ncbi:hypothetical protein ILUMI_13240 [Ignelater luminosus]|uniref:Peptidase M13 N-terminal domain-containing protein n=1 Tax=Ignelater luminosus TaxID=2038154 RepID=A0A8K0CWL2_IGNLU|nr:hypothetical protein ILUMI_13240 [Ignelater luminosus]
MPSISRVERSKKRNWGDPSRLLSALTIVIPIFFLILLSLAVFIKPVAGTTCNTNNCIEQAHAIIKRMNTEVNPCDDFYEFVCGNTLEDSSERNFQNELTNQIQKNLLKIYKEDINDSDHKLVKIEKKLFKKCMNEEDIEKDGLTRIKEVIKEVGGWPVLDGESNLNEIKFDWIEVTYKLRELGYPFSIFFDVGVTRDIENKEKFYLQITAAPNRDSYEISKYSKGEYAEILAKVAQMFDAKNWDLALSDMMEVYEFKQQLDAMDYVSRSHKKDTIEEYQKKYDKQYGGSFNWLEFLKKLVGSEIIISSYDYVSFQDVEIMSKWINRISTTSNRTVGNYMIWKLIEANIPYLPKKIQNVTSYNTNVPREEFCLEEIEKRFIQSPIKILTAKKLLPAEERQQIQEIFSNSKSEFLNLLDRTIWMEDKDKQVIRKNAEALTLNYGLPEDYFSDKIFDDMDVDMVETKDDTFLDLLAQVNKNYNTTLFKTITLPASMNVNSRAYYINTDDPLFRYNTAENELFVPINLAYPILQKHTQMSHKYSYVGSFFAAFLTILFSNYDAEFVKLEEQLSERTMYISKKIPECLATQIHRYNLYKETSAVVGITFSTAEKVSYVAYEKWLQNNEEKRLPGLNYTSRQLFWIVSTYCHIPDPSMNSYYNTVEFYSLVTLISKLNNPYFARDFKCPKGSETNPSVKCPLYL